MLRRKLLGWLAASPLAFLFKPTPKVTEAFREAAEIEASAELPGCVRHLAASGAPQQVAQAHELEPFREQVRQMLTRRTTDPAALPRPAVDVEATVLQMKELLARVANALGIPSPKEDYHSVTTKPAASQAAKLSTPRTTTGDRCDKRGIVLTKNDFEFLPDGAIGVHDEASGSFLRFERKDVFVTDSVVHIPFQTFIDECRNHPLGCVGPVGLPGASGCSGDGEYGTRFDTVLGHILSIAGTYRAREVGEPYFREYVKRCLEYASLYSPHVLNMPMKNGDEVYDYVHRTPLC